jgi:ADP-heptose:LPS heptosyltransferase
LKTFLKKIIFIIFDTLSIFIKLKKLNKQNLNIVVLLQKPLGIGDLVMLSPFIKLLEENQTSDIYIISEYPDFIDLKKTQWIKPNEVNIELLKQSLVISPTLTWSHLKYILKSKYFIGYFTSNKLISNIKNINYKYNPKNEHYLLKTFPILDILKIQYNKDEFLYPNIKTNLFKTNLENYIVIAPYSNWAERQYPLENYIKLINTIVTKYKRNIVLIGSNADDEINFNRNIEQKINNSLLLNLCGKTDILQMNYIIKNSTLFIGNDSGPANIAYIISKKSLVFFGSVYFENRLPINNFLQKNIIAIDSRNECNIFPCYDGYNKPICKNQDKYACLSKTYIDNQQLDKLMDNI